jgi:hypothetical protein
MLVCIEWLEAHLIPCPSKYLFHLDCPGCGLQRSFIALLKGNIVESFQLYPATIPIVFSLVFAALHLKFDFKNGARFITVNFILNVLIIVAFYIYKIITHKLI